MLIHEKILQNEELKANKNVYVSKEIENFISLEDKIETFLNCHFVLKENSDFILKILEYGKLKDIGTFVKVQSNLNFVENVIKENIKNIKILSNESVIKKFNIKGFSLNYEIKHIDKDIYNIKFILAGN